jgi:predicted RNA-binding protein YlqC (UPF0109 family)
MKDFIAYLVKNLVELPNDVEVQIFDGEQGIIIEVRVAPNDVGKVVGKGGRTIQALRTLALTVGARVGRRVRLELVN